MLNANIGLRLHDSRPGTLSERAGYAAAQGFTCVHLALSKTMGGEFMSPEVFTPGLADYVRRAVAPLNVSVLGCYLNLCTPDEQEYAETLKKYIAHLRLASMLGACVVGTETGNPNREYRYDPERSHSGEALELFIRRVTPVVKAAEKLGAFLAIEPVYTHIVSTPARARRVLDAVASPNLRIIFDPVNLLHPDNLSGCREVLEEAMELLAPEIDVIHLKDYVLKENGGMDSVAAGKGMMDFSGILRFAAEKKPCIPMTLENTVPENAEQARLFIEGVYREQAEKL